MIPPEELSAMKARCEKATAEPWALSHLGHGGDCLARDKDEGDWTRIARNVNAHDLAFIVHARTDVPRLIAEVERLTAALKAEREACDGAARLLVSQDRSEHGKWLRAEWINKWDDRRAAESKP